MTVPNAMSGGSARLGPAISIEARIAAGLLFVVPGYSAWAWAGLRPSLHALTVAMAAALLSGLVIGALRSGRRDLFRDPLLATGLAFLGYLSVQWWNSGRAPYFDVGLRQWTHTPPPHPGWPYGFDRSETAQMIGWFLPAWAAALAARSPMIPLQSLSRVLHAGVYAAGLLAAVGVVQFLAGAAAIYGLTPLSCTFFASFGYSNHAGAYFVLLGAVSVGLIHREVFRIDRPRSRIRLALVSAAAVACLIGANLSLSRAAVIMAWGLVILATIHAVVRGRAVLSKTAQARYGLAASGVVCALILAVVGVADRAIEDEFLARIPAEGGFAGPEGAALDLSLTDRTRLRAAAWRVWGESPWFGVGGWGFRHRAGFQVAPSEWAALRHEGWANVHCDPLQALAEYGLAGSAIGLGMLACIALPLVRAWDARNGLVLFGVAGLGLVGLSSLIDLPFRCPAILIAWATVASALPRLAGRAGSGNGAGRNPGRSDA